MESRTNAFCMQYCNNKVICYSAANDGHCAVLDDIKHGEPGPRWCRLILSYLLGQTVASPTKTLTNLSDKTQLEHGKNMFVFNIIYI